jgi:large subunit ribosomal protein L30
MSSEQVLQITLIKSPIGYSERHKRTVKALGLHRMHQTVEQPDTLVVRGMIAKVAHLVKVEEKK